MNSSIEQALQDGGLFIDGVSGPIFLRLFGPAGQLPKSWVLLIPPFGEEMNKSRRMLSLVAHRLLARGVGTVIVDLYGTGDSHGDFSDARLDVWSSDVGKVSAWLRAFGALRVQALCVRLGALVTLEAFQQGKLLLDGLVFWSPVLNGQLAMSQFLRLRMASGLMGNESSRETTKELRARLESGQTLEVAGYEISSKLFSEINTFHFDIAGVADLPPVYWLDVVQDESRGISPASQRVLDAWAEQGIHAKVDCVEGDSFWSTQEICEVPGLLDKTVQHLCED